MKKIIIFIAIFYSFIGNVTYAKEILSIIEGNVDAKIKLIIYESMTCSHCADFHKNVYPKLKEEFIDTGYISLEFRNFPLDLAALNASKLAHCKNDGKSEILHFLFNKQNDWVKGKNILDINNNLKDLINEQKFDLNFENCLNEKEIEDFILEERIDGNKKFDIKATPTLIINDKKFDKTLNFKNIKKKLKKMI